MDYKILETRIEFVNNNIQRITVLVDCTGDSSKPYSDVRAIFATTKPCGGYMHIPEYAAISNELLQSVAAAGLENAQRDKIFPNWQKRFN